MNWGELAGLEASGRRIMGHNGFKEAAMVDDYTAKMTEEKSLNKKQNLLHFEKIE